jgi:hypothetical protein
MFRRRLGPSGYQSAVKRWRGSLISAGQEPVTAKVLIGDMGWQPPC